MTARARGKLARTQEVAVFPAAFGGAANGLESVGSALEAPCVEVDDCDVCCVALSVATAGPVVVVVGAASVAAGVVVGSLSSVADVVELSVSWDEVWLVVAGVGFLLLSEVVMVVFGVGLADVVGVVFDVVGSLSANNCAVFSASSTLSCGMAFLISLQPATMGFRKEASKERIS